jgi:hypothetical protein
MEETNVAVAQHRATIKQLQKRAEQNAKLSEQKEEWVTQSAKGNVAYTLVGFIAQADLDFTNGVHLHFEGEGWISLGLGATGSLGGSAAFNRDPNSLRGREVSFTVAGAAVGAAGFNITWFDAEGYIGTGFFAGVGVQIATPGTGTGKFS